MISASPPSNAKSTSSPPQLPPRATAAPLRLRGDQARSRPMNETASPTWPLRPSPLPLTRNPAPYALRVPVHRLRIYLLTAKCRDEQAAVLGVAHAQPLPRRLARPFFQQRLGHL